MSSLNMNHFVVLLEGKRTPDVLSTIGQLFKKSADFEDGGGVDGKPYVKTTCSAAEVREFLRANNYEAEVVVDPVFAKMEI